jgi:indole-3-glycerol phosphate synthase
MMFLKKVVEEKKYFVKEQKSKIPLRELKKKERPYEKLPFRNIFTSRTTTETRIIAEIKKASPSKKNFKIDIDVVDQAKKYVTGGAYAISVITEQKFFLGNIKDLEAVKKSVKLPVLRKDFIVDEYELYEAYVFGADAVLLIAEALEKNHLVDLLFCAKELNLDVLFEIHSLKMFETFYNYKDLFLLGVNNRNLETLEIDLNIGLNILKAIPEDIPIIIESGIENRENIEKFLQLGVSGFLIGSALMASHDPISLLKALRGL